MSSACRTVLPARDGELCDAEIRVGDVQFKVHRIILCGCSSYFRDLFCGQRSTSPQQIYVFTDVSADALSLVLDFAYSQTAVVTEDNVLELLAAAERFQVKDLVRACCDLLQQKLNFQNCIHIWQLADVYGCVDLKAKAYRCMLHHFEAVAELSADFLRLNLQQLGDLIDNDELNVKRENVVFEAVVRWINFAPQERSDHMAPLLNKVRLLLMPLHYLVSTMRRNNLVKNCRACRAIVNRAIRTLRKANMRRPLTRTRLPSHVLLAIGGWRNNHSTDKMELYDVRADRWVRLDREEEPFRTHHGCLYLNGFVYCIGGYDSVNCLSSVLKFHLATRTWTEVGSMHSARCQAAVVELNGCIYAMGGSDGTSRLKSAERFEPDTNQWTLIAPMHEHRSYAGAAALRGKVYICGGCSMDEPLSSAECYNPETNQWTLIEPMETRRFAAGVIAYHDQIYVVGGHNTTNYDRSVTVYDPVLNYWRVSAPMSRGRTNFGIALLEDHLYVVGGFESHDKICNVERYDGKTNRWEVVQDMEAPQGLIGCCVVERYQEVTAQNL